MKCLKCQGEMFTAHLYGDINNVSLRLVNKKKGLFESEHVTGVECFVCPECGYVELKAVDPKKIMLEK